MKLTRKNTITYSTNNRNTPEIKLQNEFILKAGFKIGENIQVHYFTKAQCILITKIYEDGRKEENSN